MYNILPYTIQKAKELGVKVYPSDNPKYKLEIYDWNGQFITYAGAMGYSDFPHYIESHGKDYALKRRLLYKKRHEKDRHKLGSRGYYADQLLW
jgi:hypothetical protein